MIELEQHVISNLSDGASVTRLHSIDPSKSFCFSPDVPNERCIFLAERFVNFGMFGNCIDFLQPHHFILNLFSEVPAKHLDGRMRQGRVWWVFNQHNMKCLATTAKMQAYGNILVSHQTFRIEVPRKGDYSYFQLYSLPKYLRYDGQVFDQNSLLHFSIYRSQAVRDRMATPPVITLKPEEQQTFVPLFPGQRLQLILSDKSRVDTSSIAALQVGDAEEKQLYNGQKIHVVSVMCKTLVDRSEALFITDKDRHRGRSCSAVVIPSIIESPEGGIYPQMAEPVKRGGILCENVSGIVLLASRSSEKEWLCDPDVAKIDCTKHETIVTFTKKQRYVTLSKLNGFWWLAAHPNYSADTVTG